MKTILKRKFIYIKREINPKLTIEKHKLRCEKCGLIIDRDDNAAINCYNHYFNTSNSSAV